MTMQESVFGARIEGLGHDSAFPLTGLGRRPLMPAPPGLGLGAVIVSETMTPPSATSTPGPSVAPLCASCSTLNGGIAATSMAADQALREDGCIAGLGQEPEGLGALPSSIRVLGALPAQCQHWLLAFVNGSKKANVIIHGKSFGYQGAINYFASAYGGKTVYFTFTNNKATYIFAYENVNGVHAIKICTDGYFVTRTPNGKAPFTVYPPSPVAPVAGVGQVFRAPVPVTPGMGNTSITVIPRVVAGTFVPAFTVDANGMNATMMSGAPQQAQWAKSDMQNAQLAQLVQQVISGQGVASDHRLYFGFQDNNPPNWAQTPGEPTGMAIMRIFQVNSNLFQIGLCTSESGVFTGGGGGGGGGVVTGGGPGTIVTIMGPLPAYAGSYQVGTPTGQGLWWSTNQYAWVYIGSNPTNVYPPGAQASPTNNEIGSWVQIGNQIWQWFPPGGALGAAVGTSYGIVTSPYGSYAVWAQDGQAATIAQGGTSNWPPPPAGPPPWMAGSIGQWIQPLPEYYVWIPATTALAASTSWIWWLLGLTVVGGGAAYYLLD